MEQIQYEDSEENVPFEITESDKEYLKNKILLSISEAINLAQGLKLSYIDVNCLSSQNNRIQRPDDNINKRYQNCNLIRALIRHNLTVLQSNNSSFGTDTNQHKTEDVLYVRETVTRLAVLMEVARVTEADIPYQSNIRRILIKLYDILCFIEELLNAGVPEETQSLHTLANLSWRNDDRQENYNVIFLIVNNSIRYLQRCKSILQNHNILSI